MSVDLFLLGRYPRHVSWKLGEVWPAEASPISLIARVQQVLETSSAEAFLFWDSVLGAPDGHLIQEVTGSCGGVWHAGLLLGMSGLPGMMDFVNPTWMLNCDSNPAQESTSWRLSLRASLIRTEVIRKMGFISPEFKTLEAAGLDLGHRYISRGVILRDLPSLVSKTIIPDKPEIPIEDEFRFIRRRFGRSWTRWTLMRAALTGYDSIFRLGAAYRKIQNLEKSKDPDPYPYPDPPSPGFGDQDCNVSILVPTLDRYSYLRKLLDQLRAQTVRPLEIIVVDQTSEERRDTSIPDDFKDLPMKFIYRREAGQCSLEMQD